MLELDNFSNILQSGLKYSDIKHIIMLRSRVPGSMVLRRVPSNHYHDNYPDECLDNSRTSRLKHTNQICLF